MLFKINISSYSPDAKETTAEKYIFFAEIQ